MGIIGEISVPQPENLLVKCEVTLAADSTCQPCASSDTYRIIGNRIAGRIVMLARRTLNCIRLAFLYSLAFAALPSVSQEPLPVFVVTPGESKITFYVKASVALEGTFDKWDAAMTFTSPDVTTGVLDIKIQAESVNTGSGMKDGKLKSNDFFNVKQDPMITFHSDKVVQTGPATLEMPGTFTIRGVSKPETLTFTITGKGTAQVRSKGQWPSTVKITG